MAHYDIFRDKLGLEFYSYGHALWEPSPGQLHGHAPQESSPGELRHPVSIGDVGFIRRGQFHRIFNALQSEDHPINMTFGTPPYHEPLPLGMENHISGTQLNSNNFYSREVTMVSGGLNVSLLQEGGSAQVSFKCSKERGAILSLPVGARGQDTLLINTFRKGIINHIDSWFAFIQSLEIGIERMEHIILVTGCHLTRSFVNVAFSKSQNDVQASFGVHAGGSRAEVTWRFSREPIHGAMVKYGLDGDNVLENQCVFVRGFRARRQRFLPVQIQGAAEPTTDSDPPPDQHLISVPSSSGSQDPLHVLLQYLADKEPSCDMVLVHDDDLECIRGASLRSLQPDEFMGYLRDSQPETYCYQSFDYDGSSKADARVRVAMSKRGYKSSPPEDITLSTSGASRTSRSSPTHSTYGIGSLIGRMALLLSGAVTPVVASSSTQPSEEALSSTVMEPERSRTSQSVEPRAPSSSSSAISHIPRNPHVSLGASDLLIDGYISETFSPRVAVIYLACVFKVEPTRLRTFTHECRPGVFFVSNPPTDHSRPPITLNGRPAWVLDYVIRFGGSVIPQQLWPHKLDDFRRSVGQASLHLPVFFLNMDGNLGVPVINAAAGQMSLHAAHEPAPLGGGYTTKIRICWPGYRPSEQQIQLRDQTPAHNPISFERFVKHLGSRVRQFLVDCESVPISQLDPNSKWIVGRGRISASEVVLIGIVHVSAGSWMPILQLTNRVII